MKIKDYEILGARGILIELEKFEEEVPVNEKGLIVPEFQNFQTESGRIDSNVKGRKFKSKGTIVQISAKAQDILDEEKMGLKVGDKVAIFENSLHESAWFVINRDVPTRAPEGYIRVHPNNIEAKILSNNE